MESNLDPLLPLLPPGVVSVLPSQELLGLIMMKRRGIRALVESRALIPLLYYLISQVVMKKKTQFAGREIFLARTNTGG